MATIPIICSKKEKNLKKVFLFIDSLFLFGISITLCLLVMIYAKICWKYVERVEVSVLAQKYFFFV